jgi:hypothetical protein
MVEVTFFQSGQWNALDQLERSGTFRCEGKEVKRTLAAG